MTEPKYAATTTFDDFLYNASPALRREMEDAEHIVTTVIYKPTNWDTTAGWKAVMDGWKESWGTCPKCFTLRSASGNCNCE